MIELGRVKGSGYAKNKDGDRIVLLLQTELTDPEDIQTVELMSQTGEESRPPIGSEVSVIPAGGSYKVAVATSDGIDPGVSDGEKKIYSTNAIGIAVMAFVHLKNDGTIIANNGAFVATATPSGALTITAPGDTEINSNVTINGTLTVNQGGNTMTMGGTVMDMGSATIAGTNVFNGTDSDDHRHSTGTDPSGVPQ